jgi:hypothetical protein
MLFGAKIHLLLLMGQNLFRHSKSYFLFNFYAGQGIKLTLSNGVVQKNHKQKDWFPVPDQVGDDIPSRE